MFTSSLPGFSKNENCPSSHELLEFQNGDLEKACGREIRKHLSTCEFCSAEVEFYSHYPQEEGASEPSAIPAPLYELAEALLKNRQGDHSSLDTLLKEQDAVPVS